MAGGAPRCFALSPRLPSAETTLVEEALIELGLQRTHDTHWDLLWHDGSVLPKWTYESLHAGQRINHFPGIGELTFKHRLAANLQTPPLPERSQGIVPITYCFPQQRQSFLTDLAESSVRRWLLKPANAAAGRGIRLLENPRTLPDHGQWLVQEYIRDPYLWNGRKFHLRLFLLITGFEPLTAYLHREGQVLGASKPYPGPDQAIDDPYAHLTNLSIQHRRTDIADDEYVTFIPVLRDYMTERGDDFDRAWQSIRDLVERMTSTVAPRIQTPFDALVAHPQNCFGLFGLDVLLDSKLKPWLLECNLSPSLAFYAPDRRALYRRIIDDMFRIVCADWVAGTPGVSTETTVGLSDPRGFEKLLRRPDA